MSVTYQDVVEAARRIEGVANPTPVLTSRTFNALTGCTAFFKAENFQRAGAFKFRGAYNAFSKLSDDQKRAGVLTFSSGNHGAACALAGKLLGVQVVIVMNHDAPVMKKAAIEGYGGEVISYRREEEVREELGMKIAKDRGLTVVPPYDHPNIVAGQGTVGRELFVEVSQLDALVVPCGGGGLLSGCSVAARHYRPGVKIYGVEPEAGNDGQQSFREGRIVKIAMPETIADGARTTSLGQITFDIIRRNVDDMVTVTDDETVAATRFLFERMKAVVEPTGALGVAAVMSGRVDVKGKRVGIVVSGGNADVAALVALWG
ncbi:MAG: threo-3-hydroxy-L-aspartate ammonia-lyase [Fimbriimonadaceae bacterium]